MHDLSNITQQAVINSLSDGVYVCDRDRRITYWSPSAARITGWRPQDVVGRHCYDNILCHIDKDGHRLCGEEYCPLHRAMVTNSASMDSVLLYAGGHDGRRIPMQVTVAPVRDHAGAVIGGVETFRDASAVVHDMERAKWIQELAAETDVPPDDRVSFNTHYVPRDIVGGDYYAIRQLGADRYGLMLADVMGHGIAAALYTMHLSSLWERHHRLLENPHEFTDVVNRELAGVVKEEVSFATAVCGLIDLERREFCFTSAGGPEVLLMHSDGTHKCLEGTGVPLALVEDADYEQVSVSIQEGDALLLFSDGAVEVHDVEGAMLGVNGLIDILRGQGFPQAPARMEALEERLLKYSNAIRLADDLTLIEVRFNGSRGQPNTPLA
ncbi:MAG: PP2C family protein-serine/threonine phosphatase [Planctomycetota bacterium]